MRDRPAQRQPHRRRGQLVSVAGAASRLGERAHGRPIGALAVGRGGDRGAEDAADELS